MKIFILDASAKIDIGKYILEDNEEELEKIVLEILKMEKYINQKTLKKVFS